jgi:hypothetical protein
MIVKEIEKLKRHIQLMENGKFIRVDDFEAFCDERKKWADSLGSWAREMIHPIRVLCKNCKQQFELHQKDLNNSHVDISHSGHTGHGTIACLPVIIECKSCNVEDVYDLPELDREFIENFVRKARK